MFLLTEVSRATRSFSGRTNEVLRTREPSRRSALEASHHGRCRGETHWHRWRLTTMWRNQPCLASSCWPLEHLQVLGPVWVFSSYPLASKNMVTTAGSLAQGNQVDVGINFIHCSGLSLLGRRGVSSDARKRSDGRNDPCFSTFIYTPLCRFHVVRVNVPNHDSVRHWQIWCQAEPEDTKIDKGVGHVPALHVVERPSSCKHHIKFMMVCSCSFMFLVVLLLNSSQRFQEFTPE